MLVLDRNVNDQRWLEWMESPQGVIEELEKQFDTAKMKAEIEK